MRNRHNGNESSLNAHMFRFENIKKAIRNAICLVRYVSISKTHHKTSPSNIEREIKNVKQFPSLWTSLFLLTRTHSYSHIPLAFHATNVPVVREITDPNLFDSLLFDWVPHSVLRTPCMRSQKIANQMQKRRQQIWIDWQIYFIFNSNMYILVRNGEIIRWAL